VFLDVEKLDSGRWETVILNQIAARTHFLLILTPGTLDRCDDPNDMLRREIEQAIVLERNIVLLIAESFDFKTSEKFLTGRLSNLQKYNGFSLYYDFFDEGMIRLRDRFLRSPNYNLLITPIPTQDITHAEQIIRNTINQAAPTEEELNAEQFCLRGYKKDEEGDIDGAITDYNQAIKLNPNFAEAYNNRGIARRNKSDIDGAITDYNQAIKLNPNFAEAYNNRGNIHLLNAELDLALVDYTRAIELNSKYAEAYSNRGNIYFINSDLDLALSDYSMAIKLRPSFDVAYTNRGELFFVKGQLSDALSDLRKANEFVPDDNYTLAVIAITQHAMQNIKEAHRLWKNLIAREVHYKDLEWVKHELNWEEPLMEEARKLIAGL
jgi:tetratricopeptide (TPR) repeat protein